MTSLTLGNRAITFVSDGQEETFIYEDAEALVVALDGILGGAPAVTEDPNGYEVTYFDWDGIRVLKPMGAGATVSVSRASVGGVEIGTLEGVSVGTVRAAAEAAGAVDVGEGDDALGISIREVPSAQSLTRPGAVGLDFVRLRLADAAVTQLQAPAFDYGDL